MERVKRWAIPASATLALAAAVLRQGGPFPLSLWIAALALGAGLAMAWKGHAPALDRALPMAMGALAAYIAVQCLFTPSAFALFCVLLAAAMFALAREAMWRHIDDPLPVLLPVIALGILEAAMGVVQHTLGDEEECAIGTFHTHSQLACFLGLLLPFALTLAMRAWRLDQRRKLHADRAATLSLCALFLLAGVVYSVSRVGALAASISVFATVIWPLLDTPASRRRRLPWIAAAVAVGLAALPHVLASRFRRMASPAVLWNDLNLTRWMDAVRMIGDYVWWGCGAGTFAARFPAYTRPTKWGGRPSVENDYLQIFGELGVVGALITAVVVALVLRELWRALRGRDRGYAVAGAAALAALMLHALVESQVTQPAITLAAAWVAGLISALAARAKAGAGARPTPAASARRAP